MEEDRALLVKIMGKLETLESKMDERRDHYMTLFKTHEDKNSQHHNDINAAFSKLHKMEKDLTKNDETTSSLAERVEKLEEAVIHMREALAKSSVITALITALFTAGATALVVNFIGK